MNTLEQLNTLLSDRYRVERELGSGGMATVFLAEDVKHRRKVALKVLRHELAAVIGAERFLREIETTARLQHPHILPLHDSGTLEGTAFYVMPYVEGESLRDRLEREKQLPVDVAVRIGQEVASALDYAHRKGVVHRDIKPENILLHDGQAMVADFGIALAVSSAGGGTRMTETGMSLGTPHYMSPEQAMGDRDITPRSDVYALGCVLYEMLLGEPPFTGPTAQAIIARVITEEPRTLTSQRRTIPPHVEAAVRRALEKLPADRFASAAELSTALTTPLSPSAIAAVSSGRQRDWRVAAVAGALAGAIAAGFGATWMASDRAPSANAVDSRTQLTFNGHAVEPTISPDGQFVAYVDRVCARAVCRFSLMVQEASGTKPVALVTDVPFIELPRWSFDGSTIVFGGELDSSRGGLFAIPRLGGTARLIGAPGLGGPFDTHPTGDTVAFTVWRGTRSVALIVSTASAAIVDSVTLAASSIRAVAWTPDGRHLAASLADGRIMLFDRGGKPTDSIAFNHRARLRFTPAGDGLIVFKGGTVKEDHLVRVPIDRSGKFTGPPTVILPRVPVLYVGDFDIARRTGALVVATGDAITDLWTFDLSSATATGRQRTKGTSWYGFPALDADGNVLYYLRGDALGDNVYALSLDAGVEEALTTQRFPGAQAVRIAADGKRLAAGNYGDTGTVVSVIERPSRKVTTIPMPVFAGSIWPIGEKAFVARSRDSRTLVVLDSLGATPRPIAISDSMGPMVGFAPSPDGRRAIVPYGGENAVTLMMIDLSNGSSRALARLEAWSDASVSWAADGTILVSQWLKADEWPSLWRIDPASGALTRQTTLLALCNTASITVAASGRVAACTVGDFRSDIWLIDRVNGIQPR